MAGFGSKFRRACAVLRFRTLRLPAPGRTAPSASILPTLRASIATVSTDLGAVRRTPECARAADFLSRFKFGLKTNWNVYQRTIVLYKLLILFGFMYFDRDKMTADESGCIKLLIRRSQVWAQVEEPKLANEIEALQRCEVFFIG